MGRVVHVIGNGPSSALYKDKKGFNITCNVPPFEVKHHYATAIVDFKMMAAIQEGSVLPPGEWVCGWRPKKFCERNPAFRIQHSWRIKEFYTELPSYARNYTDFNCGHFAVHYAANRLNADKVHMYGFDSLFEFSVRSSMDVILMSDRGDQNTHRLLNNWRPIWLGIFNEFSGTQFVIHQREKEDRPKVPFPKNVEVTSS